MAKDATAWNGVLISFDNKNEIEKKVEGDFGYSAKGFELLPDWLHNNILPWDRKGKKYTGLKPGYCPVAKAIRFPAASPVNIKDQRQLIRQIQDSMEGVKSNRLKAVPITDPRHPVFRPGENPSFGCILYLPKNERHEPLPANTIVGPPYGGILSKTSETDEMDKDVYGIADCYRWEYAFDTAYDPGVKFSKDSEDTKSRNTDDREDPSDPSSITLKNALLCAVEQELFQDMEFYGDWNIDALDVCSDLCRVNDPKGYHLTFFKHKGKPNEDGLHEILPNVEAIMVFVHNVSYVFYRTVRNVLHGEELLVSYGEAYWRKKEVDDTLKEELAHRRNKLAQLEAKREKTIDDKKAIEELTSIKINNREEFEHRLDQKIKEARRNNVASRASTTSVPVCLYSLAAEYELQGSRHSMGLNVAEHYKSRCKYVHKYNNLIKKCSLCSIPFLVDPIMSTELNVTHYDDHVCSLNSEPSDTFDQTKGGYASLYMLSKSSITSKVCGKFQCNSPMTHSRFPERCTGRTILSSIRADAILVKTLWTFILAIWPSVSPIWHTAALEELNVPGLDLSSFDQAVRLIIAYRAMVFEPNALPNLRWIITFAELMSGYIEAPENQWYDCSHTTEGASSSTGKGRGGEVAAFEEGVVLTMLTAWEEATRQIEKVSLGSSTETAANRWRYIDTMDSPTTEIGLRTT